MRIKTVDENIKGSFISQLAKYNIGIKDINSSSIPNTTDALSLIGSIELPKMQNIKLLDFEINDDNNTQSINDYGGGKGSVKVNRKRLSVTYPNGKTKIGGHRNWRNNNPGNLEYGKFARANGAIGTDGRFAIFPSMEVGYKAQANLLKSKSYRNLTFRQAIAKYAPSFENNTNAYINNVARRAGINPNVRMRDLSNDKLMQVVKAMSKYEGMKPGKVI